MPKSHGKKHSAYSNYWVQTPPSAYQLSKLWTTFNCHNHRHSQKYKRKFEISHVIHPKITGHAFEALMWQMIVTKPATTIAIALVHVRDVALPDDVIDVSHGYKWKTSFTSFQAFILSISKPLSDLMLIVLYAIYIHWSQSHFATSWAW